MESSLLDYVAQACMDLTEAMASANSEAERDSLIINHIKKVWPIVPSIDDFKKSILDSSYKCIINYNSELMFFLFTF